MRRIDRPLPVRKAAIRGTGMVAARWPLPRRPRIVRRALVAGRVDAAELRLRRDEDPAAALDVLRPLLLDGGSTGMSARAWEVAARSHEALGDPVRALDAARRATRGRTRRAAGFLLLHRLADATGDRTQAEAALRRLATRAPATPRDGAEVLRTLARDAPQLLDTFADTLTAAAADGGWVAPLRAQARLTALHGTDPDSFAREALRVRAEVPDGDRVVLSTLLEARDWFGAAALATRVPDDAIPLRLLRDGARRSLRSGQAAPAAALGRRVLDRKPADELAAAVVEEAEDVLRVAASGLDAGPAAGAPAYNPLPRRVLSVLAQSLPLQSGGYATRSHGIVTGLRDLGWEPRAVTRLGFPYDRWAASDERVVADVDVVDGIEYHRLLGGPQERVYPQYPLAAYVGRMAERIARHATEHRAALLHASSFHVNGLATAMAARRLGVPHVYEMRGLEDLIKVSRDPAFAASDRHRFITRLELENCRLADRVLVITEALGREMAGRGVPEDKIVVLPNGVHAERFQPRERDRELEAALGYRGRTVIGYVGGLVDYEGLDLLLEAVAALRALRDDVRLLVVGDGHYEKELRALAGRLRIGDVVTFTGRVPHAQVARYLSLVDITPFPRRPLPVCELISPIKPFEAMAMGKAAVVSSVAALTEIVRDEDTGLVFAKGDAADLARVLGRLLDAPELRARLGERARAWVRAERDWSRIVRVADATYRDLLAPE